MFNWLRRLLGSEHPSDMHVHVHLDGNLRLYHEGTLPQGSTVSIAPAESAKGDVRANRTSEESVGPELFADLGTPEVSFGRDVELPPTRREGKDSEIS